jgi:DNA-directed RNA polymerase specialized sigma24 family protein
MATNQSFVDIMSRLRRGDSDAEAAVFHRFARRLIALARSRLDGQIRQKIDPEDVLQSVYKSFFQRQAQGQFVLDNWDALWALLTLITARKCGRWIDFFHAERRDVRMEDPARAQEGLDVAALAGGPSPVEAAVLTETLQELLTGLSDSHRNIVALGLHGYTTAEISEKVGRSERTVNRVLESVGKKLERDYASYGR